MKKPFTILFTLLFAACASGQSVGISSDGAAPDASAMLDVSSTTKGMLIPRMSQAQIGVIATPPNGLQVFNTDDGKIYVFLSSDNNWKELSYGTGRISPPFVCGNPFFDYRDYKSYPTLLIGTQCWFAENLNIGTRINGSVDQANNGSIEKYCYADNDANCAIYGGLYQWNEMMQYSTAPGAHGICPTGWHLPADAEWTTLTTYVGAQAANRCYDNSTYIAKALATTTPWSLSGDLCAVGNTNFGVNNATGFSALPGGRRNPDGSFTELTLFGVWWSSTHGTGDNAWLCFMGYNSAEVSAEVVPHGNGFSVRCLRD